MRAVSVYIVLSFLPWAIYGVLAGQPFFHPALVVVPLVLQLLNVIGFVWWTRVKREAFKKVRGYLLVVFRC